MLSKIRALVKQYKHHIFLGVCVVFLSYISYHLGQIKVSQNIPQDRTNIPNEADIYTVVSESKSPFQTQNTTTKTPKPTIIHTDQRVVVSKASKSKLYHYTWCSGAKRIKLENQIWFNTASVAQAAGYSLALNCKP